MSAWQSDAEETAMKRRRHRTLTVQHCCDHGACKWHLICAWHDWHSRVHNRTDSAGCQSAQGQGQFAQGQVLTMPANQWQDDVSASLPPSFSDSMVGPACKCIAEPVPGTSLE